MSADLLVVTEDGRGKRTAVGRYRATGRAAKGVRAATVHAPLVGALIVTDADELVLATSAAKVERIAVAQVPRLGRATRGVRLVKLGPDETVTAVALAPQADQANVTLSGPRIEATGVRFATPDQVNDPAVRVGRVALRPGEQFATAVVLHPASRPRPGDGARLAVPRGEWATSTVHAHSNYWCGHCGIQLEDPEAVYEHIDAAHASGPDEPNVTVSGGPGEASRLLPVGGGAEPAARLCWCGCGTPLRPDARRHARYFNATHRKRAQRSRGAA
jgi:hypothetical protein